ncbi:ATP9B isoform 9, partial [Pan troglodytes]
LDQDVKPEMAMLYPELYKDLTKFAKVAQTAALCVVV